MQKIGKDKWKHFYVGIAMGCFLQAALWYLMPHHLLLDTLLNFIIAFIICYGFELYSKFTGHGHYEFNDVIAGMLGSTLGTFAVLFALLV